MSAQRCRLSLPEPVGSELAQGYEALCVYTHGVRDHGREHRPVRIVCVELPHQDRDHGELYDENYGMEQRLREAHEVSVLAQILNSLYRPAQVGFTWLAAPPRSRGP